MKYIFSSLLLVLALHSAYLPAQTTLYYQGFENASVTCTENWGYTGGNRSTETSRTGSYSLRVGRSGESNTATFNTLNIAGISNLTLQVYHSVRSGSGPGMDTREGAVILVSLNGGAWTPVGQVGGYGDLGYTWTATSGGSSSSSSGCTVYQCPNPLVYPVPAGTNTIALRVVSVQGNSSCGNYNTYMNNGTAGSYNRTDEGFQIDDVRLTTTSSSIPGIWTGASNTDWFNCLNWNNNIVPTATTNVTIDQTAVNNCVVGSGAAVCNSINLTSNNGTTNDLTIQNNASLTVGGNVTMTKSAGSGDLELSILNTATFRCNNLTITGSAVNSDNCKFNNEVSTTNVTINGNLTLNDGGRLDLTNSPNYGIIHIKGNYTNNALETDFKQSGSIIYFDGTGNQSINTDIGFTEVFANMIVNKPSGTLTVNTPLDIENNVTYTSGRVYTTAVNLLSFYDNSTATGMSNSSFTDGPVRKIGDDAFTFPVGTGTDYQPATISAPGNTSHHFTVQYFHTDPGPTYNDNLKDPSLDHISNCEYWIIDRTNGNSNVNVTLSWDANSCGVTNLSDLRVARWDGSMWKDHGNGGTTGTTGAGTVITSGAVTSFSPFTLASVTIENPLPVELVSFNGDCQDGSVRLKWITASEVNNAYFILESSADGFTYHEITRVPGAGNSNQQLTYEYSPVSTNGNDLYYKLTQVDYNGSSETFQPVTVQCSTTLPAAGVVVASVSHQEISLSVYASTAGADVQIGLYNAYGRSLNVWQIGLNKGANVLKLNTDFLSAGIYILRLQGGGLDQSLKLFVK